MCPQKSINSDTRCNTLRSGSDTCHNHSCYFFFFVIIFKVLEVFYVLQTMGLIFFFFNCIYFCCARSLLLCAGFFSWHEQASHHSGFSCGAQTLGLVGFRSGDTWAESPQGMWNLWDQELNQCLVHQQADS